MSAYDYEKIANNCKILSNNVRLKIITYLDVNKVSLATNISKAINCNIKTVSQHIDKLYCGGIINKAVRGRTVELALTPKGKKIIEIIKLI